MSEGMEALKKRAPMVGSMEGKHKAAIINRVRNTARSDRKAGRAISRELSAASPTRAVASPKMASGKVARIKSSMASKVTRLSPVISHISKAGHRKPLRLNRAITCKFSRGPTPFNKPRPLTGAVIKTGSRAVVQIQGPASTPQAQRTPMMCAGPGVQMGMAMVGGLARNTGRVMSSIDSKVNIGKCLIAARTTSFQAATGIAHKARVTSWFSRRTGFA